MTVASYSYDASGNRVKSVEGGETVHYVFDGLNVIQENRPASGSRTDYIFAFGRQLARVDNATTTTIYVTGDHLGSSSILTNAAGAVVGRYAYDPYGQILTDTTGAVGQAYKYTGKPLSSATGLYYYGARWYDPAVGRFTSQDPARDGENWYAYCYGNPINLIDPTGLDVGDKDKYDYSATLQGMTKDEMAGYNDPTAEIELAKRTDPLTGVPDITGSLMREVRKNAEKAEKIGEFWRRYIWFYRNVRGGGPMDFKSHGQFTAPRMKFKEEYVGPDFAGNYNYGYVGAALEIPARVLWVGAGSVQIMDWVQDPMRHPVKQTWMTNLYDDPRDTRAWSMGYLDYGR